MPDHLEMLVVQEVFDITPRACEKIVDANDDGTVRQQTLAEMRAEEASTSCD